MPGIIEARELIAILEKALSDISNRKKLLYLYEDLVGANNIVGVDHDTLEEFLHFQNQIAYYSNNPEHRKEESSLIGDHEMDELIRHILEFYKQRAIY